MATTSPHDPIEPRLRPLHAMGSWQEEAKHCPMCSAPLGLVPRSGRPRLRCEGCGFVLYANPASAALGVILNEADQVLLVRRTIEPFRGFWALPAGYQEIDEEPTETVRREILEETGLEVRVIGLLDLIFQPEDPRKPANVAVFLCRPTGGVLRPGEEENDVRWFSLDALPERIGFDNDSRILSRLGDRERYPESPWSRLRDFDNDFEARGGGSG